MHVHWFKCTLTGLWQGTWSNMWSSAFIYLEHLLIFCDLSSLESQSVKLSSHTEIPWKCEFQSHDWECCPMDVTQGQKRHILWVLGPEMTEIWEPLKPHTLKARHFGTNCSLDVSLPSFCPISTSMSLLFPSYTLLSSVHCVVSKYIESVDEAK